MACAAVCPVACLSASQHPYVAGLVASCREYHHGPCIIGPSGEAARIAAELAAAQHAAEEALSQSLGLRLSLLLSLVLSLVLSPGLVVGHGNESQARVLGY